MDSTDEKPCIYKKFFRYLNLSFHRAKKDQCLLCMTYKEGDDATKEKLRDKFEKHISEKKRVREIKIKC